MRGFIVILTTIVININSLYAIMEITPGGSGIAFY